MVGKSWAATLRLPKSTFPPRPLPELRARYIERCADELYKWQAGRSADKPTFVLHDGPPYANGDLHIGHALNKILKDMILRVKVQQGRRVRYVPGWDCHGLPIELKALARAAAAGGGDTSGSGGGGAAHVAMEPARVRALARDLAESTVLEQMRAFRSYGVMADWDARWLTMQPGYVGAQLRLFRRMVERGLVYRRHKPVYWSPSSRTALAEAELEYNESHVSTASYVKLPLWLGNSNRPAFLDSVAGAADLRPCLVIWTTTPWTLPANQAVAVHADLDYMVVQVGGDALVIGANAHDTIAAATGPDQPPPTVLMSSIKGRDLVGLSYINRLQGPAARPQPVIHADFVTAVSGTGLVHLAPGHGFDDYEVCLPLGIPAISAVDEAGQLAPLLCPALDALALPPGGAALDVLRGASKTILGLLADDVIYSHKQRHKYPYDWRTKQPIVVRAAAQWFADVGGIKASALAALRDVRFVPEAGRTRLESFVAGRSEWCISRQRAWGVPIPALYDPDGEPRMDPAVVGHLVATVERKGVDAWWTDDPAHPDWIPEDLRGLGLRRGMDTMDVWFDSGSSWAQTPCQADVYLEGTDQHRGWFQSSLLTRVADGGQDGDADNSGASAPVAPFKTLITHGFTLDAKGKKMSKSLGNVISPAQIMDGSLLPPLKRKKQPARNKTDASPPETGDDGNDNNNNNKGRDAPQYDALGPDALRLWVAGSDYTKDVVVAPQALASAHASLIRYRTTIKMLLGSVSPSARAAPLHLADQIALLRLEDAMRDVGRHLDRHEFYRALAALNIWLSHDLSAFYLEVLKDRLYCGDGGGAIESVLDGLCRMLAPLAPLLVEEAWDHTPDWIREDPAVVHPLRRPYDAPLLPAERRAGLPFREDEEHLLRAALPVLDAARAAVNAAAEQARSGKKIGSALQLAVALSTPDRRALAALRLLSDLAGGPDGLASLLVVSAARVVAPGDVDVDVDRHRLRGWEFEASVAVVEDQQQHAAVSTSSGPARVTAVVTHAVDHKCPRCWRYLVPAAEAEADEDALCRRCEDVVGHGH